MQILDQLGISRAIQETVNVAESSLLYAFDNVHKTAEYDQYKVIEAFRHHRISARHFTPTTGYGYSDEGREALAAVFSRVVKAGNAVVSPHIASGTHAISLALYAVLRPQDTLISVTGKPYDTLHHVIGIGQQEKDTGSLANLGVGYRQVDLRDDGTIDIDKVISTIQDCERPKAVFLQRSRGYAWRRALTINDIREFATDIKARFPDIIVIVDNCYGEFCEIEEPIEAGADLIAGSMIKNPGRWSRAHRRLCRRKRRPR